MFQWLRAARQSLWQAGDGRSDRPSYALRAARLLYVLGRDVVSGNLNLRAMSLVYTTLLSLVPLLALSFSVLKAFGVHNQVEPTLRNVLSALGEQGDQVTRRILTFIDNVNVGVLGVMGLALLVYTAVSVVQKIEESFNFIWHVRRSRGVAERFGRYLSVLLIGPLLVFTALGMTTSAMNSEFVQWLLSIEPLGRLAVALGRVVPYLLVVGAFTFIYLFVPNTRVRLLPAFIGGAVGGALWQTAGWLFASFVATSTRYSAIYSGFAVLVLFMIWLYVSWLVLLLGASTAFYVQYPQYVMATAGEPRLSNRMRERLALSVMTLIGAHFVAAREPWTLPRLVAALHVPNHAVQLVLDSLERGRLLSATDDDIPAYVPARDIRRIALAEVLDAARAAGEENYLNPAVLRTPRPVDAVVERLERSLHESLGDMSVATLAEQLASQIDTAGAAKATDVAARSA
jgi:membrane protein